MAGTITVNNSLMVVNGNYKSQFAPGATTITQNNQGEHSSIVVVGTAEEVISMGDIVTAGWCTFHNLDTTNYVQWGPTSAGAMVVAGRLKPGESYPFRLEPGISLRMKANTAPCKVLVKILED